MGEFRLHAISIDEVRDIFGAEDDLAERLRGCARAGFSVPSPRRRGLWSRLVPLTRTDPDAPVLPPGFPTPGDVEDLLAGRYVPPEHLSRCWRVLDLWLAELAWGTTSLSLGPDEIDDLEFDLARAGLPAELSLRRLLAGDPQIPLRPAPDMRTGYSRSCHVAATHEALSTVAGRVDERHTGLVEQLVDFLARFCEWSEEAPEAGRPAPDLLVVWHASPATLA